MDSTKPRSSSSPASNTFTSTTTTTTPSTQQHPRHRGLISEWVRIPERLTNTMDIDEFEYAPVDRIDYMCGVDAPSITVEHHLSDDFAENYKNNIRSNAAMSRSADNELTRSGTYRPLLASSVGQHHPHVNGVGGKPFNGPLTNIIRENFVSSSTPSSQETTPYCTPQSSPLIQRRKPLVGSGMLTGVDQKQGTSVVDKVEVGGMKRSASATGMAQQSYQQQQIHNQQQQSKKQWFYNSLFQPMPTSGKGADSSKHGIGKLHVTNFDINAVGPTSW